MLSALSFPFSLIFYAQSCVCSTGKFGEKSGTILEAVVHWNYRSISRGNDSLYGRLHHEDGSEFIALVHGVLFSLLSVFALFTCSSKGGDPQVHFSVWSEDSWRGWGKAGKSIITNKVTKCSV